MNSVLKNLPLIALWQKKRKLFWITLFFVSATLLFFPALAQDDSEQGIKKIIGYWLTDSKDGIIELYQCREKICGRFHWLKDDSPENPSLDDKNHDPELRKRQLCGMQFMGGFEPKSGYYYSGGWIYSIRDGNTYNATLKLLDNNTLELRGYFLLPVFGESRIWTRTISEPSCKR